MQKFSKSSFQKPLYFFILFSERLFSSFQCIYRIVIRDIKIWHFYQILGYFQFIKEKEKLSAVENVEKCSQINNNLNKKIFIIGIFEEIGYQKCFWEKPPGKTYSLKLWLQEKEDRKLMIGSSVKNFGPFCQKPLEAILYKESRQPVCY